MIKTPIYGFAMVVQQIFENNNRGNEEAICLIGKEIIIFAGNKVFVDRKEYKK